MLGTGLEPGIVALTLNDLFRHIQDNQQHNVYRVTMSYLEVSTPSKAGQTLQPLPPAFQTCISTHTDLQ